MSEPKREHADAPDLTQADLELIGEFAMQGDHAHRPANVAAVEAGLAMQVDPFAEASPSSVSSS